MNPEFPPLPLARPHFKKRRRERPRGFMLPIEDLRLRAEIFDQVIREASHVSKALTSMSDAQRKAVFVKLEHSPGITKLNFTSTDLKPIAGPTPTVSFAVPRENSLEKLEQRLSENAKPLRAAKPPKDVRPDPLALKLQSISLGQPKDRLSPELAKGYEKIVKSKHFIYEIEVVTLETGSKKRQKDLNRILQDIEASLGKDIGGRIYESEFEGPVARAVLWSTGEKFKHLVEDQQWLNVITWFERRPKFETFIQVLNNFNIAKLGSIVSPPEDAPAVCIVDSGVSPANPFLAKVVRTEHVKSYVPEQLDNPYDENGHGSGIASLAAYYALGLDEGAENRAKVWIASARILNADGQLDSMESATDEDHLNRSARLLSKVLRQVVSDFSPLGIKIFVLSYTIINRLWNAAGKKAVPRSSWVSRTIDKISREFDVVFVLITGNIAAYDLNDLYAQGYPEYFVEESTRLQDPAHSALAITAGSLAHSTRVALNAGAAIAQEGQPSPFTRTGPGINGAIKPEFVELGGNSVVDGGGRTTKNPGTNVVMASHHLTPPLQHDCGTSYAAPRVAYHLALIQHALEQMGLKPSATLLKAFLASSTALSNTANFGEELAPDYWQMLLGLGKPDGARATDCDGATVVAYYDGKIDANKVALFSIPVPAGLAKVKAGKKRLSVTVCFAPEVQRWGLEEYYCVRLKFRVFSGDVHPDDITEAMTVEDGEDNLPALKPGSELKGRLGINLRSKGTLQHDVFEWTQHPEEWSKHPFTLAISGSRASWGGDNPAPVPFSVVVRLEDTTQSFVQLYAQVKAAVRARAQA